LPKTSDTAAYEAIYPYYIEQCALSEIDKKPGFGADIVSGGPGGHSVLYLSGVCRVDGANYPEIALCSGPPQPGQGVGISANAHFANANWVATNGRQFFFHGDLPDGAPLTRDAYAATQIAARDRDIYNGVTFHDEAFDGVPDGISRDDWKYEISIATDYAVDFGRDRYCARMPVSRAQMQSTVARLNLANQPYRNGSKTFEWSVFYNNCSHLTHKAIAATCEMPPWPQNQSLPEAAVDMPVPKNKFVDLMRRGNDTDIADPVALYEDQAARQEILTYGRLPAEPGVLADISPVVQPNDVYGTDLHLIFYQEAIFGQYQPHFDAILNDPRYSDLRANFAYFTDLYRQADAAQKKVPQYLSSLPVEERGDFPVFYAAYRNALKNAEAQLDLEQHSLR
jgi:hypothetical protein